ncbi:MAG: NADH-quinone oxidoreductase subunit J [Nitrospiraceae bacterium]|jgi:NADH-quinone oxidoreductase subunit J|nr:NADH-quinone oxidoreductase subunit J [Nitrospiraceae bacterium]|tara:strand:- start:188 stop:718 length:531 start_codon:yes stop_codon:yes gene_type:complete
MTTFFFAYLALISIASGILTVALRNPVHCGLALLTLLLHVAGFFILLNSEFLAMVQIIVYAGAILVLYLFVLMLLNLKTEERVFHQRTAVIAFVTAGVGGVFLLMLLSSPFASLSGNATPEVIGFVGHTKAVGITIFNDFLLQFEIIAVFLLGAIIGAIVLAKTPIARQYDSSDKP